MKHSLHLALQLVPLIIAMLSVSASAAELEFYDDGPTSGKGYPFSESVRVGDMLFLSGIIGVGESGERVEGGIVAETHQVFRILKSALERRGLGLDRVFKCTVFLDDIADWPAFNEVYQQYFKAPYPARSALATGGLALSASVELECMASYAGEAE